MITVRACGVGSNLFGRYKETSSTSMRIWIRFETIILNRTRDRDHSTSMRCRFGSKVLFGRYKETSSTSVRVCIWLKRRDKEISTSVRLRFKRRYYYLGYNTRPWSQYERTIAVRLEIWVIQGNKYERANLDSVWKEIQGNKYKTVITVRACESNLYLQGV